MVPLAGSGLIRPDPQLQDKTLESSFTGSISTDSVA
jgi:hypothetical protein